MNKNTENIKKGKFGEEIVEKFLKNKGYSILAKNIHNKYGEIDIVAEFEKTIIFVEVKSIFSESEYKAEDHFNHRKRMAMRRAINFIIEKEIFSKSDQDIRVDLIVLTYINKNCEIKQYKNVEL